MAPPVALNAQFSYTTNDGTITITGYTGLGGAVTIPDTINGLHVTSIGSSAFAYCTGLTSVIIPNSVTTISSGAFFGCTGLTGLVIPNSVISIGYMAFSGCTRLVDITIPNSVTSISSAAFYSCSSLTNVSIADGVSSIGDSAFAACGSLQAITVAPFNPTYSSVDGVLFNRDCTTLFQCPAGKAGTYAVPTSVTAIGNNAFEACLGLARIDISNGVTVIGDSAFLACYGLASLVIPNSVTRIGRGAFAYCTRLTNFTIPDNVTNIEDFTFEGCGSLTTVSIPDGVTSIGAYAFLSCMSLTNVTVPYSVTVIGKEAFRSCTRLLAITVDPRNTVYSSVDGVLFNKDCTTLVQCPAGKAGTYAVPTSVTAIGNAAFVACLGLTRIDISNGVTLIGDSAFWDCYKLTGAYFGGDAPGFVGANIFGGDDNVVVYYLPGTKGWGETFGDHPTALWVLPNPVILSRGSGFGVQSNGFGFVISWATNVSVVVDACTDLANPAWLAGGTNTLTQGWSQFADPQWTNYARRFYRIRSP